MLTKISTIVLALMTAAEAAVYDMTKDTQVKDSLKKNGLNLMIGETATLILDQNLSTGYGWEINEDAYDGIYSVSSVNKSGSNPRGFVGVAGSKEITVKGLTQGTATFQAAYVRPWEFGGWASVVDNTQSLNFQITVANAVSSTPTIGSGSLKPRSGYNISTTKPQSTAPENYTITPYHVGNGSSKPVLQSTGYATSKPTTAYATSKPTVGYAISKPTTGYASYKPNLSYASMKPKSTYASMRSRYAPVAKKTTQYGRHSSRPSSPYARSSSYNRYANY